MRTAAVAVVAGLVGGGAVMAADLATRDDAADPSPAATLASAPLGTAAEAESQTTASEGATATAVDWSGVAAIAGDGVVSILATSEATASPGVPGAPGGGRQTAQGSGFVIDRSGNIVTNQHVVDGATSVRVRFRDGASAEARVVGTDATTDLAVIRVTGQTAHLHPLTLRTTDPRVGEAVLAVGNPFGYDWSVSAGVVSGLGREITSPNGFTLTDAVQTDAAVNHGNSGGPLVDRRGRVIGVNAQIADSGVDANVGVAFAVPIDETTTDVIEQLRDTGRVRHSWLGISGAGVTAELAAEAGLKADAGVLVTGLVGDGPAQAGGLRGGSTATTVQGGQVCTGGDIITSVAGTAVAGMDDLQRALAATDPGDRVPLGVVRADGTAETLQVTLSAQPAQAPGVDAGC
jgi:S1-C subfamily serine protease